MDAIAPPVPPSPGGYAPPWLLVWSLLVLAAVPGWGDYYLLAGHALAVSLSAGPFGPQARLATLLALLLEALPMALLALALLAALFPALRRAYLGRRHRLAPPPAIAPWPEIAARVHAIAPGLPIGRTPRPGLSIAVVPAALGRPHLLLSDAFAQRWQADEPGARHELGRAVLQAAHGDHLLLGPGSLLHLLVRRSQLLLAACLLLPVTLFGALGWASGEPWLLAVAALALLLALWALSWYAVFIAAVWCAELNLDRSAGAAPSRLRRWLVRHQDGGTASLLLLLLFPAAYLARLALLLSMGPVSAWVPGMTGMLDPQLQLREALWLLPLFALVLIAWPHVGPGWEAMFTAGPRREVERDRTHLAAALFIGALMVAWPNPPRHPVVPEGRLLTAAERNLPALATTGCRMV